MVVDWTISVGNIMQIVAFIGAAAALFFAMKSDIRILKHDVKSLFLRQDALSDSFKRLGDILTQVAVQDTRINRIEDDVKEIRHGEGFVMPFDKSRRP